MFVLEISIQSMTDRINEQSSPGKQAQTQNRSFAITPLSGLRSNKQVHSTPLFRPSGRTSDGTSTLHSNTALWAHTRIAQRIDVRLTLRNTEAEELVIEVKSHSSQAGPVRFRSFEMRVWHTTLCTQVGTDCQVFIGALLPRTASNPCKAPGPSCEAPTVTCRPDTCEGGEARLCVRNTPAVCLQASLYKQLNEDDLLHGLWRRRCRTEDTRAALTLVSAGLLPAAQDVLLDVMRKPWEQDSASAPPAQGRTTNHPL